MTILYTLLSIIALILIIAAFLPKTFELKAQATIKAPLDKVRDYVKLFENQKQYSVRVMKDPNSKITYKGTQWEVGAMQARDSEDKDVGKWEQEMKSMTPQKSMKIEIRFEKPMAAVHQAENIFEQISDSETKVTNIFTGKNPRPGNFISMFFLPKVEKDMQQNMDNLKTILEK